MKGSKDLLTPINGKSINLTPSEILRISLRGIKCVKMYLQIYNPPFTEKCEVAYLHQCFKPGWQSIESIKADETPALLELFFGNTCQVKIFVPATFKNANIIQHLTNEFWTKNFLI